MKFLQIIFSLAPADFVYTLTVHFIKMSEHLLNYAGFRSANDAYSYRSRALDYVHVKHQNGGEGVSAETLSVE